MKNRDRTPDTSATPEETADLTSTSGEDVDPPNAPDKPNETNGIGSLRNSFRPVLALMVLTVLGLIATAGFKSYRDLDSAKDYERELLDKIDKAEDRIRVLDDRIESIRNDDAMLERLAREDLGLVHADEVVIVLPDPSWARPSAHPAGSRRPGSSPEPAAADVTPP